jgi:23S rRNA pseudouridine1911/1915/1917 synthase
MPAMKYSSKVPESCSEISVLAYLAKRFTYLTESAWSELVQEGRITCNGCRCDMATTVSKGDSISCDLPEFEAPVVNFDYDLVYEDEWLLAVNKPPGLRVHSSGKFVNANLIYHLRHLHQPPYPEANLINRLDADTSGLVLLARDKVILSQLMRQFAAGLVVKEYLAVVTGRPCPAHGTIDLPIGPVQDARVPRFGVDSTQGKPAVTHYRTLRHLTEHFTLLELKPETGRTHQLRVHLAAIGHPIAGDALYTMNDHDYLDWRLNPNKQTPLQGQALHSHRLQFSHPVGQTLCTLIAPLAPNMVQFIKEVSGGEGDAKMLS